MIAKKHNIKVAALGYVSVGKTTLLNAIFRDKFGEVSMGRTTAGINVFNISSKKNENTNGEAASLSPQSWCSVVKDEQQPLSAASVLSEIKASNQALREAHRIEEKEFNIVLDQDLCEMRQDTALSVVDIPGINEAETDSIYKQYVNEHWKTFDCVIVVMDARQGVNTAEQVDLLQLVKKNLSEKKDIPVIILCNKVDDPDDEELSVLVLEAKKKVEEVFGVSCRDAALQKILEAPRNPKEAEVVSSPAFITTSAIHAFFYRSASLLNFEQFQNVDKELLEKFGREEVGRFRWKKMTEAEKYDEIFLAVSDESRYEERLAATNFDKFLATLAYYVGGQNNQLNILAKQIDIEIQLLLSTFWDSVNDITQTVSHIHDKCRLLGKDPTPLKEAFWKNYYTSLDEAKTELNRKPLPSYFREPIMLLNAYKSLSFMYGWKEDTSRVANEAKSLFQAYLAIIVEKYYRWDLRSWETNVLWKETVCPQCTNKQRVSSKGKKKKQAKANPSLRSDSNDQEKDETTWGALSPYDWRLVFESLLAMSCNQHFCESFHKERFFLEHLIQKCSMETCEMVCYCSSHEAASPYDGKACKVCSTDLFQSLGISCFKDYWKMTYRSGKLQLLEQDPSHPLHPKVHNPDHLSSVDHWGHVVWQCCKLLEPDDEKTS